MQKIILTVMPLLFMTTASFAAVQGKEITYKGDGLSLKGYFAYDDSSKGKRPGVLIVHEWWGHNDYVRKRADMLAQEGYAAFALDMYGDGKTAQHPDDAKKFVEEVTANMEKMKARFMAALQVLKKQKTTDGKNIAAIGYCFGGATVLNMARAGVDLKGVVSFHGNYATQNPAQKGKVKARVLVCHGEDDEFIPQEQIDAFRKEMDEAKVDYQFLVYDGAKHSFTNPAADEYAQKFGMPIAYDASADKKSWDDMLNFFKEIFR